MLVCRGGAVEYTDALQASSDINWVPALMCVLNEGSRESEGSLLAEDDSPAWHTRGQFHWEQLIGDCGAYPEYGRVRHFRLRGFELTLEARDVVVLDGKLDYFKFAVSVRPDARVTTGYTQQSGYLHPEADCSRVRRGNERRMCRDLAGNMSWRPCSELGR